MSDAARRWHSLRVAAEQHTVTAEVAKVQQLCGLVETVRRGWVFQSVRQTWLANGIPHWEYPFTTGQTLRALI